MPYDDSQLKEFDNCCQANSASNRERAESCVVAIAPDKGGHWEILA